MPDTPPPAVPVLDPDVALAETDDGAVLLQQRTGRYWQLNRTGLAVLRRLTEGRPTRASPPNSPPVTAPTPNGSAAT